MSSDIDDTDNKHDRDQADHKEICPVHKSRSPFLLPHLRDTQNNNLISCQEYDAIRSIDLRVLVAEFILITKHGSKEKSRHYGRDEIESEIRQIAERISLLCSRGDRL